MSLLSEGSSFFSMNFEFIFVIAFLLFNLLVGVFFASSTDNIRDYALGGRNFSTGTLAATLIATWIGGDNFALYLSETYSQGLYFILSAVAGLGSFLLVAYVFAPRVGEFLGQLSIAEAMGGMYGKEARVISAVAGYMLEAALIAFQFKVSSDLLSNFFGIPSTLTTIAICFVVIVYAGLGGIKAVTFTDIIQFFTFSTIMPLVVYNIWNESGGADTFYHTISTKEIFDPKVLFDVNTERFWSFLTLFLFYLVPGFSPSIFQRISMSKNIRQITKAFMVSSVAILVVQLFISMIAILIMSEDATLDPNGLFAYMIENHTYTGLRGLIIVGVLAMIMSSVDSGLNSSSILLTHDFFRPIGLFKNVNEITLSRISLVITGAVAVILALWYENLFALFLFGYSFYMPVVTVPFLLALLGFRSTKKVILLGMAAGFLSTTIWPLFGTKVDNVIPGFFANLIVTLLSHYLLKSEGGWIGIKDTSYLDNLRFERQRKMKRCYNQMLNFKFMDFCLQIAPKKESTYTLFGIFTLMIVLSSMYNFNPALSEIYEPYITYLYQSVLVMGFIFLTYSIWPPSVKSKKFISLTWFFGLIYLLPFIGSVLAIVSDFNHAHVMMFMLGLVVMSMLVSWQLALILITLGVILGINSLKMFFGLDNLHEIGGTSSQTSIMYALLLVSSVLVAFLRPKQVEQRVSEAHIDFLGHKMDLHALEVNKLQELKNEFIRNLNHEIHTPVTGITSIGKALHDSYDKLSEKKKRDAVEAISESSLRLESLISSITDLSKLSSLAYDMHIEDVNFSELTRERVDHFKKLFTGDSIQPSFVFDFDNNVTFKCDKYYISQLIDNLVSNAISYGLGSDMKVSIKLQDGGLIFEISDQGIGIPEEELFDIFNAFIVSSRTKTIAGGRGIGLALCAKIVSIHGGKIWAKNNGDGGGATFSFFIPSRS